MIFGNKRKVLVKKSRQTASVQQEEVHKAHQGHNALDVHTYYQLPQDLEIAPSIPLRSPARARPQSHGSLASMSTDSSSAAGHPHRHSQCTPSLRKKHSPTCETLREIRAKQSEAALRTVYETQTLAYLSDNIELHPSPIRAHKLRWSSSESSAEDDIPEEDEEAESPSTAAPNWWTSWIYSPNPEKGWPLPE